jgi:hypothetical protein
MTRLEQYAGDLARTQRDALKFPTRPIVRIPHDPMAHATLAIRDAAHDFTFAIAEAYNATDREGMTALREHLASCIEALQVVEAMARDFAGRMPK